MRTKVLTSRAIRRRGLARHQALSLGWDSRPAKAGSQRMGARLVEGAPNDPQHAASDGETCSEDIRLRSFTIVFRPWQAVISEFGCVSKAPTSIVHLEPQTRWLRSGVSTTGGINIASPDTIKAMPPEMLFDYLGVCLSGPKATGKKIALNLNFTERKTALGL
jgi:hypothetical protein